METSNKNKFWNFFSYRVSIKSPFNIQKFNLCIPTSLGAQIQTYVKKIKFHKTTKNECNLDKTEFLIFLKQSEILALKT